MPARSVKDQCLPPSMRVSYVPLLMPVLVLVLGPVLGPVPVPVPALKSLLMMKTSLNLTAF
jgi:hypothetical protein